jgi:hypothetical protein
VVSSEYKLRVLTNQARLPAGQSAAASGLLVELDLGLSAHANARNV